MEVVIGKEYDGQLLRTCLHGLRFSNRLISHLKCIPEGITVNGDRVTVRYILR